MGMPLIISPDITVPNLTISEKDKALLNINESDFEHHLAGKQVNVKQYQARQKQRAAELKLARTDYQLYQGLMMLKGIHSLNGQMTPATHKN